MNEHKFKERNETDFTKGRKLFLALMPLPEGCSQDMRRGFEAEAAKVRETTINDHMATVAEKVGL